MFGSNPGAFMRHSSSIAGPSGSSGRPIWADDFVKAIESHSLSVFELSLDDLDYAAGFDPEGTPSTYLWNASDIEAAISRATTASSAVTLLTDDQLEQIKSVDLSRMDLSEWLQYAESKICMSSTTARSIFGLHRRHLLECILE